MNQLGRGGVDRRAHRDAAGRRRPIAVVAILSAFGIVLTEAMSNSAVVALLMPVALGIATQFGMDPRVMALVVAVPAGLAFTLPVGTPANAIAYSSGYLRLRDMLVPGALLVLVAWVDLQPGRPTTTGR